MSEEDSRSRLFFETWSFDEARLRFHVGPDVPAPCHIFAFQPRIASFFFSLMEKIHGDLKDLYLSRSAMEFIMS